LSLRFVIDLGKEFIRFACYLFIVSVVLKLDFDDPKNLFNKAACKKKEKTKMSFEKESKEEKNQEMWECVSCSCKNLASTHLCEVCGAEKFNNYEQYQARNPVIPSNHPRPIAQWSLLPHGIVMQAPSSPVLIPQYPRQPKTTNKPGDLSSANETKTNGSSRALSADAPEFVPKFFRPWPAT
jgi:hypothetical protein